MIMKRSLLISLAILSCSVFSFAQQKSVTTYEYSSSQARVLDVVTNAHIKPLVAEIEIITPSELRALSSKLSPSAEISDGSRMVDVISYTDAQVKALKGDESQLKANATFQLCQRYSADVLVGALYNVYTNESHDGYDVKVIFFPARIVNWRSIVNEDMIWINREKAITDAEKTKTVLK